MSLPWISREHHEAVIKAKDALILSLEAQNAVLAERLAEPIAVTVKLEAPRQSANQATSRRRGSANAPAAADTAIQNIDWAAVDENDNTQMAKIAAQELGRPVNAYVLAETIGRIRYTIREAKMKRLQDSLLSARVGSIGTPASPQEGENYVPPAVRDLIAEAEKV